MDLNEAMKRQLLDPAPFIPEQHPSASLLTCFVKYLAQCWGTQLLVSAPPTVNWLFQISSLCLKVKDRLFTRSPFKVAASIVTRFLLALYGTDV